jgi:hypothetical protein
MKPETAEAICAQVNGETGSGWQATEPFYNRISKANRKLAKKVTRESLATTKKAVKEYEHSPHFTFRFHVEHDSAKAAKACVTLGKMGVDPDGLIFGEALG